MSYYYTRMYEDLERSRRSMEDREIELRRSRRAQEAFLREEQLRKIATLESIKAEKEYEDYLVRRSLQQQQMNTEIAREKIIREQQLRDHEIFMEAERLSRIRREEQLDRQQILQKEEEIRQMNALERSRRAELEVKTRISDQIARENILVKEEQLEQQKLEAELASIDIQIGTIFDQREERRRRELLELQKFDQDLFKVKHEIRASKIKQTALQDSLNNLSKIIVPGAR